MVDFLKKVGTDRFQEIDLEIAHTRLVNFGVIEKYKDRMVPIVDGWYYNTQSNTGVKFLQIDSIITKLGIDAKVEIGSDFIPDDTKKPTGTKRNNKLIVKFPDGEYIAEMSPQETFLQCIFKIGVDELKRKNVEWAGKPLISSYKQYNSQIQVGVNSWVYVPSNIKDKVKILRVTGAMLHLKLEVSTLFDTRRPKF